MRLSGPERVLRRLVAKLAVAKTEDRQAVLAELSIEQRETIEALLMSFIGEPLADTTTTTGQARGGGIKGLSPWLTARLEGERRAQADSFAIWSRGRQGLETTPGYVMTPAAADALRSAAAELAPTETFWRDAGVTASGQLKRGLFRRSARV